LVRLAALYKLPTPNKKNNSTAVARRGKSNRRANPEDVVVRTQMDRPLATGNSDATLTLRYISNFTSNGSGIINSFATNNPNGSTDWASCAALWDSYRVEEMTVEYIPILNLQQATSTNCGPLFMVFDPDQNASIGTTVTTYIDYQNMRSFDLNKHWSYTVKRFPRYSSSSSLVGAYTVYADGFVDTATPVGLGSIQWLSTGNTISTTFGQYIIHWRVRFVMRH